MRNNSRINKSATKTLDELIDHYSKQWYKLSDQRERYANKIGSVEVKMSRLRDRIKNLQYNAGKDVKFP